MYSEMSGIINQRLPPHTMLHPPQFTVLKGCCFCVSLKTATLVLAVLTMFGCLLTIVGAAENSLGNRSVDIVFSIFGFICGCIGLAGVVQIRLLFVRAFYLWNIVWILAHVAATFVSIANGNME
eukprot:17970_1